MDWRDCQIAVLLEALPALRAVQQLALLHGPSNSRPGTNVETFVERFPRITMLELSVRDIFDWGFLRTECALKLDILRIQTNSRNLPPEAELQEYISKMSRQPGSKRKAGVALEFVVSTAFISFVVKVGHARELVEVLAMPSCERQLGTSEIDSDGSGSSFKPQLCRKYSVQFDRPWSPSGIRDRCSCRLRSSTSVPLRSTECRLSGTRRDTATWSLTRWSRDIRSL